MKKVSLIQKITIILFLISLLLYISTEYNHNQIRQTIEVLSIPTGMSAEETVEMYFKFWDDKNTVGCDKLWVEPQEFHKFDLFDMVYSVKLTSCYEFSRADTKSSYSEEIARGNYYDYTYILVHFNLANIKGSTVEGCWGDGETLFGYFLVKKTKDSDWRIKSAGL